MKNEERPEKNTARSTSLKIKKLGKMEKTKGLRTGNVLQQ